MGSSLTLHDRSLFPSLSLPDKIVLTKEREKEGEGWRGWGMGCMCCSVVTGRGRARGGGGRRELEGERGCVGEKDRVPEKSTSLIHTLTVTQSHTHLRRLPLFYFAE